MRHAYTDIRGTITECTPAPAPTCARWTYQKVAPGMGNLPGPGDYSRQRRRHVIPHDPATPAQLARRATFAQAVAEWQAMTQAQRDAWRAAGAARSIPAYNAFISARTR